jgi:hypothetical protein
VVERHGGGNEQGAWPRRTGGARRIGRRAARIGCAGLLAAALAGLAVLTVRLSREADRLARERAETARERTRLAQEVRAMKEEARRLHEDRVAARKERLLAVAERLQKGERREYARVVLRSACPYDIAVALRYEDLDEAWVTRGWWLVPARGKVTTDAMTRGRALYLYAENQAVGRTWDGAGSDGSASLTITDSKFDHVEGEPFAYEDPRSASFFRHRGDEAAPDLEQVFECPVEEPLPAGKPAPSLSRGPAQGEAPAR